MLDKAQSLYFDFRRYGFEAPPELQGQPVRHKVAIVGAGPVGLAVALGLARHGVASVVIEADDSETHGSRALCISRRSMEILQNLGASDAFEAMALPWTSGRSFFRGQVIYELEMPHTADERYFPMSNLQQNFIERLLLEEAMRTGLVEVRWQSRLTDLTLRGDGASLQVETPDGAYTLETDWLVAADGARSVVRDRLGLRFSGTSYDSAYLIADIRMKSSHPIERRAWFDSPVNRGSTILVHKQPCDMWRIDYQLRDEDDEQAELQPARIRERIQDVLDMAGEQATWELDWFSLYKAHCLCLDDYRQGRALFVGDAAHLVPIFGVRGLNSGFADAENLAWKLAMVIGEGTEDRLLDSYSPERRAATLEIFREASKSTNYMTPPSRGYKLMRAASLSLALSEGWAGQLANPRQSAPHDYTDSVLNSWPEADAAFGGGPVAGAPVPSVALKDGGHLTDHLNYRPTALYFTGHDGDEAVLSAMEGLDVLRVGSDGCNDPDGHVARVFGAQPGTLYLLRPDWHVAARAKIAPEPEVIRGAIKRMTGGQDGT